MRNGFIWIHHLLFIFILLRGKVKQEQKPLMTLVGKKQSTKHELGSRIRLPIGKVPHVR